ncbi:hypothetical protein ISCGN_021882 [Ixodes scapularis]
MDENVRSSCKSATDQEETLEENPAAYFREEILIRTVRIAKVGSEKQELELGSFPECQSLGPFTVKIRQECGPRCPTADRTRTPLHSTFLPKGANKSCTGKLMEKMALHRLEWHLDNTDALRYPMTGFRKHCKGATAASLLTKVRGWRLRRVDFFVVYVGGNDLDNGRRPDEVCRDILDLVEHLWTLATTVFVFKLLPRCWVDPQDERRRLALNRKLAKGVKGTADVVAINPDPFFLNGERKPKCDHFASDGCHVSHFVAIRALSRLIKVAARNRLGARWVGDRPRLEITELFKCCHCKAKGHKAWACLDFRNLQ